MPMPTRKFAIVRSWRPFRHLREVSEQSKTGQQVKELERINAISLNESNRKGPTGSRFGSSSGCRHSIFRLQEPASGRNHADRDGASGRRGKGADPTQGGYGRGVVPPRSGGH